MPKFHAGGIINAGPNFLVGERSSSFTMPGEPISLMQRRSSSKFVRPVITMKMVDIDRAMRGRKKPITDDMRQMCDDLGIEPSTSFEDYRRKIERKIIDALGLPATLLGDPNPQYVVTNPPWARNT